MKKFWKPLILAALTALCVAPAHALEYVAPSSVSLASAYGESSLTLLLLLSPPKPLRWVSTGTPASTSGH